MPQIAQQDYLRVEISSVSFATNEDKNKIKKLVEQGVIFDCVFAIGVPGAESYSRVINYDPYGTVVYLWDIANEEMGVINYTDYRD